MSIDQKIQYDEVYKSDIVAHRPDVYSGQDIDFNKLTDRNFEVLLYRIFKDQITRTNELSGKYDKVLLMSGVREMGRDCALFYDTKPVGLVQCKKYGRNITLKEVAEEIIKFILFSIINQAIFDVNNTGKFVYYLAVSKGIANDANNYLGAFGKNAICDSRLKQWTEKVISSYSSLSYLEFDNIKAQLKEKLSQLIVEPILPHDLSSYLRGEQSHIMSDFFSFEKVITESMLNPIKDQLATLEQKVSGDTPINIKRIVSNIKDASYALKGVQYSFSNSENIHIYRPEVSQIFNWIVSDEKDIKTTSLVVGVAGCGKSVIMRAVLLMCDEHDIAVLGLKSDMQKSTTMRGLTDVINLSIPIVDAIRQVAKTNNLVVVIIDQIDALSQYLSTSREYVNAYIQLIENLKLSPNIKIIISTRIFDLENDPIIQSLEKDSVKFTISEFSDEQTDEVLVKVGLDPKSLNADLYKMLHTPVNLNILCGLHANGNYDTSQIRNLYQLYEAFWGDKIIKQFPKDKASLKKLLFAISQNIYDNQDLYISVRKYNDDYSDELAFLKSQGVIIELNNRIGFFHQSFYDFVYAKNFINNGGDVLEYINSDGQSIKVRASLKIILAYLRDCDLNRYIDTIKKIITDDSNRFHIQYLVYSILGSESSPYKKEKDLVEDVVLCWQDRLTLFLPLCSGSDKWVEWVIQNDILSQVDVKHKRYHGAVMSVVYNNLNNNTNLIVNYVKEHRDLEIFSNDKVVGYLCGLMKWDDELLLFAKELVPIFDILNHQHRQILKNILTTKKEFVFANINLGNICKDVNVDKLIKDYDLNKFINELIVNAPHESYLLLFNLFNEIILNKKLPKSYKCLYRGEFYDDAVFYAYNISKGTNHYNIMDQFVSLLGEFALNDIDLYDDFFSRIKDSRCVVWNLILADTLIKSPLVHQDKIVYLLNKALNNNEFSTHDRLHHKFWILIKESFPLVQNTTRIDIVNIINEIAIPSENKLFQYNGKVHYPLMGRTKYSFMRALPLEYIKSIATINRHYGELFRRYGDNDKALFNWDSGITMASYISAPLSSIAYEKMSPAQWRKSFNKYNDSYNRYSEWPKGGKSEHSAVFKSAVEKLPDDFYHLIKDIIYNNDISNSYKRSGVWGLIEASYCPEKVVPLFIALTKLDITDDFTMMLMARTLSENCPSSKEMFNYISEAVVSYKTDIKDTFSISYAINNAQGVGVGSIILAYNNKELHDQIFEILFNIANHGEESSKLAILSKIVLLNNIDADRAYELFTLCTINVCDEVIKALGNMLRYYFDYFDKMQDFYEKAIENVSNNENKRTILIYLIYAMLENRNNGDELYVKAIAKWGIDCAETIIDAALSYMPNQKYTAKCYEMLNLHIDSIDENVIKAYSFGFLRHKEVDLILLLPFVQRFITSNSFNPSDGCFYDYLFKQSAKYPNIVLDIIHSIDFNKLSSEKEIQNYRINESRIRVVLGALNSITNNRDRKKYTRISTDILDDIVRNSNNYHYTLLDLDKSLL